MPEQGLEGLALPALAGAGGDTRLRLGLGRDKEHNLTLQGTESPVSAQAPGWEFTSKRMQGLELL